MRTSRIFRARVWLVFLTGMGLAVPTGVGLVVPGIANSDPGPAPSPLAIAIDTLESNASDPNSHRVEDANSLSAAEAIIKVGVAEAAAASDLMNGYQSAVQGMAKLGIDTFLYPTAAPFCAGGSRLPLDAAPAAAGAVPGPWPKITLPLIGPVDAVQAGQTLFAFVPYGLASDGDKTTGMQVAWFNMDTLKGGFAPMGTVAETAEAAIPPTLPEAARPAVSSAVKSFLTSTMPLGGVRAVPVQTGEGTVLAAVFGTVQNGEASCFFFPTVGITEVS
ncbi:hypothetical protein [Aldersonia kunmingensis]|uniref:hypothetical protein n=1 Tax=Aldersonia kunmingensis TaxID=408066 RepID=UPI000B2ED77A|nr:hypothetical protein [Aldersonia kunmingensis]